MKITELANRILKIFYDCAEEGGYFESYIIHLDKLIEETGEKDVSKIINAWNYLCEINLTNGTLCEIVEGIILPLTKLIDAKGITAIDGQITNDGAIYVEEQLTKGSSKMKIEQLAFEILNLLNDCYFGEIKLPDNHLSDKEITQKTGEKNRKKMLAATRFLENNNYIKIHPRNFLDTYESHMQRFPEPPYFNFEGVITEKGMMTVERGNFSNEPIIKVDSSRHTFILGDGNIVQSSIGDITIISQEVTDIIREIEENIHNDNELTKEEIKDALSDLMSLIKASHTFMDQGGCFSNRVAYPGRFGG